MNYEEWILKYKTKVFYPTQDLPDELPVGYSIKAIHIREQLAYYLVFKDIKGCNCNK